MRAVVSLVARYRSPTTFEYANEACYDVSVGGMFIKSAAPAPTGTLLKLECEPDDQSDAKIRGVARVVWLRRESNEHGPSGMGVKFVKLEAGSRELIETIVQRLAEAGVQARSVSSAPETQLASVAAGGSRPVQLITAEPSEARSPAADGGELSSREISSVKPVSPREGMQPAAAHDRDALDFKEPSPVPHDLAPARLDGPQPLAAGALSAGDVSASASSAVADNDESEADKVPSYRPTGSSRPPAKKPGRFGVKYWILAVVLVLVGIALLDRRGLGPDETEVAPEPAAAANQAPIAPPPSAAEPAANPREREEEAAPAPPVLPVPGQPVRQAQPDPVAAATEAPAAAAQAAPDTASPSAPAGPLFPITAGKPPYVIEFTSRPNAAIVMIDEATTFTTPYELNVGGMPDKIKVAAKKPGYKSSSIWLAREQFVLDGGVLRRKVHLTLKTESEAP